MRTLKILIVMGKTDPDAPAYRQQSQILVPKDTAGVTVERSLTVFGYEDHGGHGELEFDSVRVPATNLIAGEGGGFAISQARLGPGRIHHCMRAIGVAERALELMVRTRASARGLRRHPSAKGANIQDWIAESRIELEMARLLVMKTAWLMDTVGNKHARVEISGIKFAVPEIVLRVIDRSIQVHGAAGVSGDFPLASMWAHAHPAPGRRPGRGAQADARAARAQAAERAAPRSAADACSVRRRSYPCSLRDEHGQFATATAIAIVDQPTLSPRHERTERDRRERLQQLELAHARDAATGEAGVPREEREEHREHGDVAEAREARRRAARVPAPRRAPRRA